MAATQPMSLRTVPDSNPWEKIQNFIDQICSFQMITPQMKMNIYEEIYNYYTAGLLRLLHSRESFNGSDQEPIVNLYDHIEICLQNRCEQICQSMNAMQDEDKLRLYQKYWNQYKDMSYILNSGCYYINRYLERGQNQITIDVLSEQIWERFFFKPLLSCIAQACLNLIKTYRNNKSSIDFDLIKATIQMYMDDNFNLKMKNIINADSTVNSISNLYGNYLEIELLRDAEDFYRQQKMPILELDSMTEYLKIVTEKLDKIVDSHGFYLPPNTLQILLRKSGDIFVPDDKLNLILGKLKTLVWNEKYEELADLYKTISRISTIKTQLIKLIESYVYQTGSQHLEDIRAVIFNNLEQYVQTINKIFMKYLTVIREIFDNDSQFLAALNTVYQRLVNEYSIIGPNGNTIKSPELLARYCDVLLRKENKVIQETDFEDKIKRMMCVFDYLEDKDIFIKFYQKMLAKRLIDQISTSDDYEELIILKLKQVCGVDYISKLQQMFQDIRLSKTLIEQYKTENRIDTVDFSIMVLTSNVWPFSRPLNITLSPELQSTFDSFTNFYNQQHTGRRLIWLYQYSKGELQTLFADRRYHLQVSMYQMIVLLLFNKSSNWTVQQIEDETEIQKEFLLQTIYSLLTSRLLTCSRINEDFIETDINLNDSIHLSSDFTNAKVRIHLNSPMKSIKQKDSNKFDRTIDEDRHLIIQAAIIRIMKARGTLEHTLLMQEVIDQLKSRFKPNIPVIKKCIEILIEKEYLQRQPNEKDILEYLA